MKRGIVTALLLAGWLGVGVNFASAQFGTLGQPPIRPRSNSGPFINQGLPGGMSSQNYYGLLRQNMETSRQMNELQQRLNPDGSLRSPIAQQDTPGALGGLQTGHSVTFFNTGRYFPLTPPMGSGTGLGGMPGFGMGGMNPGVGQAPFNRGLNSANQPALLIR